MKKTRLLTIVLLYNVVYMYGQNQPGTLADDTIGIELLREDLRLLRKTIQSSQPGLYMYTSKDTLDHIFDVLERSFNTPLTSIEFFRKIAPLNGLVRNLHTRFWPAAAYEEALEKYLPRFPFDVYWHHDKLYVLRNHSIESSIKEGDVIQSINGEPAEDIFKSILSCRVRDGFNMTYPTAQASRNFSYYYAQVIGTPNVFTLQVISESGAQQRVHVPALSSSQINNSRISKYQRRFSPYSEDWDAWIGSKEPALQFVAHEDYATLIVRTFYLPIIEENGQDYESFFAQSFAELKKRGIRHLIIDLRNNHGGTDPVAMSLLSYLHGSKRFYYRRRSSILKPAEDTRATKRGDVYEMKGRGVWKGKIVPATNVYSGKVYVLMNGYCVSAAAEFIGHLKSINRATFVGEETGGNPVVFTGGAALPVDLPHTRITGTIPLHLVEMNVDLQNTGHGVMPDYPISESISDVLAGKDLPMEFVLTLIARNR